MKKGRRSDARCQPENNELVATVHSSCDDIGNRSTAAERGVASAYTANSLNQYTNILSGLAPFSPEFDLDGNQTLIRTSTGIWTVTYNGENRPVTWTCGITNIVMAYDRMGSRVVRDMSVSGSLAESKRFAYDGYLLIQESDLATSNRPQATSQSYVWDPTEPTATRPLAMKDNNGILRYYTVDLTKNICELLDATGTVVTAYGYTPFGAVDSSSGTLAMVNPFRFSSEYADDTLGLVYYNYRHYNPVDGRWTSRDLRDMFNYLFCRNGCTRDFDFVGLKNNCCCNQKDFSYSRSCCINNNVVKPKECIIKIFVGHCCGQGMQNAVTNSATYKGLDRLGAVTCFQRSTLKRFNPAYVFPNPKRVDELVLTGLEDLPKGVNKPSFKVVADQEISAAKEEAARMCAASSRVCCKETKIVLEGVDGDGKAAIRKYFMTENWSTKVSCALKKETTSDDRKSNCSMRGGSWNEAD